VEPNLLLKITVASESVASNLGFEVRIKVAGRSGLADITGSLARLLELTTVIERLAKLWELIIATGN
jgi:hypothetical protein